MTGRRKSANSSRLAIALAVLLLCAASFSQQQNYPRSKGPVSDYAGKLTPTQVTELTSQIQDYERQTSIEITVVVADSLQGQSARQYAIGIGNFWGVGKANRNNGIVLLWAPNEREYSLRIADGLAQELGDDDAAGITRNNLLPNFRRQDYYAGLQETVNAVMQHLGNENWVERLRLRQEKGSATEWFIPSLVAGLGLSTVVLVFIYRRGKRNQKLHRMAAAPDSITKNLSIAQQNAPRIQQLLDDFKKEMPEQDLTRFTSDLAAQPGRMTEIMADFSKLNVSDVAVYTEIIRAKNRAEAEANLLVDTGHKLDNIRRAKAQSQQLIQKLSKENFRIADVKDGSKREEVNNLLSNSRSQYMQANQNSSMSMVDWMIINDMLNNSQRQVQQAVQASQAEPYVAPIDFSSGSSSTFDTSSVGGGGGFSDGSGSSGSY